MPWDPRDTILTLSGWGGGEAGGAGVRSPHQTKICFLVPKNTFTDIFDFTCDIGDFRAPNFRPQST